MLSPRQETAIDALLEAPNQRAAAHQVGISEQTLYRWFHDPEFRQELDRARAELIEHRRQRRSEFIAELARRQAEQLQPA